MATLVSNGTLSTLQSINRKIPLSTRSHLPESRDISDVKAPLIHGRDAAEVQSRHLLSFDSIHNRLRFELIEGGSMQREIQED